TDIKPETEPNQQTDDSQGQNRQKSKLLRRDARKGHYINQVPVLVISNLCQCPPHIAGSGQQTRREWKDIFEKAAADQMWQDRNRDAGKCSQYRLPEQDGEQCNQNSKPSSAQASGQNYDSIRLPNGNKVGRMFKKR